jgi:rhodanese-related sulfurtransferase/DNA-binding transcriptional ArsR family regulator
MITSPSRRAARAHYGELARIGRALSSPARLQILDLLRQGDRHVEELAEAAGLTVANSSRHLQQMRAARLVDAERDGRHVRYRLATADVSRVFGALRGLAEAVLPEMDRLRRELSALGEAERETLLGRVERGEVTLLDVRPAAEYRHGHLPGARSVPLGELPARLGEVPRGREVVAYCRGPYCTLAAEAVRILAAAGFRASHLDLGAPDLRDRGGRVEAGEGAALPALAAGPARRPPPSPTRTKRKTR